MVSGVDSRAFGRSFIITQMVWSWRFEGHGFALVLCPR